MKTNSEARIFPTRGTYRWDIKNQLVFNSNKQHFTVLFNSDGRQRYKLENKLTQLQMATDKSDAVLKGNKKRVIARHVDSLKETIATVNKLRLTVEAEKIAKRTSAEEIGQWNSTVENHSRPTKLARSGTPRTHATAVACVRGVPLRASCLLPL